MTIDYDTSKNNWTIIFKLKQLQLYLHINDLIEVSLLNKFYRLKLEGEIFKSLTLTEVNFIKDPNYFMNFNKRSSYLFSSQAIGQYFKNLTNGDHHRDSNSIFKSTKIDPFIHNLRYQLKTFFQLTKVLKFEYFDKANYYIFPLTALFNNLNQVKIIGCWISLYDFYLVINSLTNLEVLEVNDVRFVKLEEKELKIENLFIPKTLKKLYYKSCFLELNSIINPYKFLFSPPKYRNRISYDLPPHNLPNLKTLEYFTHGQLPSFILIFLNFNSQLLNLNIQTQYFTDQVIQILSKSNKLKSLKLEYDTLDTEYMENLELPKFWSIDNLYISYVYNLNSHIIQKICLACPNLTKLHLIFPEFNIKFLNLLILKLQRLKSLRLESTDDLMQIYDLSLYNVKYLTLCIKSTKSTEIILPVKKSKLVKIKIKLTSNKLEIYNELMMRHLGSNSWLIKLKGDWLTITRIGRVSFLTY